MRNSERKALASSQKSGEFSPPPATSRWRKRSKRSSRRSVAPQRRGGFHSWIVKGTAKISRRDTTIVFWKNSGVTRWRPRCRTVLKRFGGQHAEAVGCGPAGSSRRPVRDFHRNSHSLSVLNLMRCWRRAIRIPKNGVQPEVSMASAHRQTIERVAAMRHPNFELCLRSR